MTEIAGKPPICRSCGSLLTTTLVDLGYTPLSNAYVNKTQLDTPDRVYPLHARVCGECFLVQIDDVVPTAEIFTEYPYFSSYSDSWVAHAKTYVEAMITRYQLGSDSRVVEIASNDGYLLQHFLSKGVKILGIEPAANVAAAALQLGVPTEVAFFGQDTAGRVRGNFGPADLITANNVLAHTPDINDLIAGVAILLAPEGVFTAEFPHLLTLIEQTQFDTIYHEHFSYLSLLAFERIVGPHGLQVVDVEMLSTHGGSLRVFVSHLNSVTHRPQLRLDVIRAKEHEAGLDRLGGYSDLAPKVAKIREDLLAFLDQAETSGRVVAAYGAAAKGNTLLNYCGIKADRVAFVCDRNPAKQGRFMPGSRIPIVAPDVLTASKPDYVLILPWNLREEISQQLSFIGDWGARFVIPLPALEIFDA